MTGLLFGAVLFAAPAVGHLMVPVRDSRGRVAWRRASFQDLRTVISHEMAQLKFIAVPALPGRALQPHGGTSASAFLREAERSR